MTCVFPATSTSPAPLSGNSRPAQLNLASTHSMAVAPSSPTSYDQPPTPEHPPPSPTTAMFGIQQKINASPKVDPVVLILRTFLQCFDIVVWFGHLTRKKVINAIKSGRHVKERQCQVTLLALLDISAAFDCVDHNLLLQRLQIVFGLSNAPLEWIRSFLSDRTYQLARVAVTALMVFIHVYRIYTLPNTCRPTHAPLVKVRWWPSYLVHVIN